MMRRLHAACGSVILFNAIWQALGASRFHDPHSTRALALGIVNTPAGSVMSRAADRGISVQLGFFLVSAWENHPYVNAPSLWSE